MKDAPVPTRSQLPAAAAVAQLPEELRKQLQASAEAMKAKIGGGGGNQIRLTKKKTFKLPSGEESAGPLRVVVIDFASYNAFFDRPFSEKEKTPPACYAVGQVLPANLVPSPKSPDKQSESCKGCPNNEFGSKGAGKACGNHYRLAVAGIDKPDSEMFLLQLPPTSGKHWEAAAGMIRLQNGGLDPIVVSTEIWFDQDKDYAMLRFGNFQTNPFIKEHLARRAEATALVTSEPDVSTYVAPARKGR